MILSFKIEINGKSTFFIEKILACYCEGYKKHYTPKLHTIRKGHRFKAGNKLHLATGVRTKQYDQFNKLVDGLQKVVSTQPIEIIWNNPPLINGHFDMNGSLYAKVYIGTKKLGTESIETLAKNDGFDNVEDFFNFFNDDFEGQIIHWTDLQY